MRCFTSTAHVQRFASVHIKVMNIATPCNLGRGDESRVGLPRSREHLTFSLEGVHDAEN